MVDVVEEFGITLENNQEKMEMRVVSRDKEPATSEPRRVVNVPGDKRFILENWSGTSEKLWTILHCKGRMNRPLTHGISLSGIFRTGM